MLLPSDVARLVLGYLQEEGLSATSQAFIKESPNLKEYAEHTIGDGAVPACVFSVFGKGLTTILNEYMAARTKETCHEVPVVLTSLWKKLDLILKQIKSLQNTSAASTWQSGDSPVQIIVSEQRLNPGPMSPGRRKWDTPRKRSGALSGPSGTVRSTTSVSNLSTEPQPEEVVDENFPQLVIQNARDKILGDRSLQEKLAENINKILANDPTPQTSKAPSSTVEADPSIDEILGLQGEIHMSDDAIHDILEQTESDPAFQALFDLFDNNKTRLSDTDQGDGDIGGSPEESDTAGPSSAVEPFQREELGATEDDASDTTPTTVKTRAAQERKTRKATTPNLSKKTVPGSSSKPLRVENGATKLIVSQEEQCGVPSAAVGSNGKEKGSPFGNSGCATPMDIDDFLDTPTPTSDTTTSQVGSECVVRDSFPAATALSESTTVASSVDKKQNSNQARGSKEGPAAAPSSASSNSPVCTSPEQVELPCVSSGGGETQHVPPLSLTPESASSAFASAAASPSSAQNAAAPASLLSSSTSETQTAASFSSTSASPSSSLCGPVIAASDTRTTTHNAQSKAAADSSNIVSLKIIISDNQDESSSGDKALNQAISSISMDKIPTIYLSSPAKSLGCPGTPRANFDETALAVRGLQSSEVQASPFTGKAGPVLASPLTGTSHAQPNYILQLPLDTATPALPGATASYFLVTEPPNTDADARQLLVPASKGQPLPSSSQYSVTTATHSQGFATGSALIIPSPVKPVMLPVSVMGQNTLGNVQMVSNQLVAISNPVPKQQSEASNPKPPAVPVKPSTTGTVQNLVGKLVQPLPSENTSLQSMPKDPSANHRRILCFESSAKVQAPTSITARTTTSPAASASPSQHVVQTEKDHSHPAPRTKPTILSGNKPKRRIETVRCSADPQTDVRSSKDAGRSMPPQQQQKDVKKNSRKQDHNISNPDSQSASSSRVDGSLPATLKKSESRRSKSTDRKRNHEKGRDEGQMKDSHSSRSSSSDSALKSGSRKDESSRKESSEKAPAKPREGRTEKKAPSQEMPNVTANKENEIKGRLQEQQQPSAPLSSTPRDCPPAGTQPTSKTQTKTAKAISKTSSLAKQAAEMLQDIQGQNSSPKSVKRPGVSSSELIFPRNPGTGCNQQESTDCPTTPSRHKKGKDGEGTPKHVRPPNTPDVPTCSPASETGSENSVSMAAHTLMILSRAAIARAGTPLKDSLRQEGVGERSPTSSKTKKRKQSSPTASPPAKKESKSSPSKKNDQERKKLINCFPHDLDVDKFLSSLHYDE
ncbi:protein NPAT [Aulostomus maculatus]